MKQLVTDFPQQLQEALDIGRLAQITRSEYPIHKIFVAGMGGSGIGANFVEAFIKDECVVPMLIGKGYDLPKYVDENTLAIVSSYSGNTEETLSAFDKMQATGAKVVCVASGGKVIQKAKEDGLDYIQLPSGKPSPRACLGYSFVQQLFILNKLNLISDSTIKNVEASIELLKNEQEKIKAEAYDIAEKIQNKIPVIYSAERMEPVAVRFRQQIAENAKMLAWHHVFPEMNHNELVGWTSKNENLALIYLRNQDDNSRTQVRIEITQEIIQKYTSTLIEVWSKGDSFVEQVMYCVHLVDWISVFLSDLRGVDVMEVNVIDYLKGELGKL